MRTTLFAIVCALFVFGVAQAQDTQQASAEPAMAPPVSGITGSSTTSAGIAIEKLVGKPYSGSFEQAAVGGFSASNQGAMLTVTSAASPTDVQGILFINRKICGGDFKIVESNVQGRTLNATARLPGCKDRKLNVLISDDYATLDGTTQAFFGPEKIHMSR